METFFGSTNFQRTSLYYLLSVFGISVAELEQETNYLLFIALDLVTHSKALNKIFPLTEEGKIKKRSNCLTYSINIYNNPVPVLSTELSHGRV